MRSTSLTMPAHPWASASLKVLKDARLVMDRPAGNRRIDQVDPAAPR